MSVGRTAPPKPMRHSLRLLIVTTGFILLPIAHASESESPPVVCVIERNFGMKSGSGGGLLLAALSDLAKQSSNKGSSAKAKRLRQLSNLDVVRT